MRSWKKDHCLVVAHLMTLNLAKRAFTSQKPLWSTHGRWARKQRSLQWPHISMRRQNPSARVIGHHRRKVCFVELWVDSRVRAIWLISQIGLRRFRSRYLRESGGRPSLPPCRRQEKFIFYKPQLFGNRSCPDPWAVAASWRVGLTDSEDRNHYLASLGLRVS